MHKTPQITISLAPDGSLQTELPGANGSRRIVPIESLSTIQTILASQLHAPTSLIGTKAAPTTGQVYHWEHHLNGGTTSDTCPWCIAESLGIDTSPRALRRAKATYTFRAGDGSVKVRHLPPKSSKLSKPKKNQLDVEFTLEDIA